MSAPESPPATTTAYNVAFLLRHYPAEMHVQGPDFFMGKVDEAFLKPLRDLAPKNEDIGLFVGTVPAEQFVWVGVRVTADSRLNCIAEARHRVEGFVDACSLTIESGITPSICDVVFVGLAGSPEMHLSLLHYDTWIHMVHGGNEGTAAWQDRCDKLRARLVLFFRLATDSHPKAVSDLGLQLRHSLRLFRHGVQTRCYGVEFICKFCALEGLVCGDLRHDKKKKLMERLTGLLPADADAVRATVESLWSYRCEAVHTARAFDSGSLGDGEALGVNLEELNRLLVAVVVFVLDRLPAIDTVSDLWKGLGTYVSPPYARARRPAGMTQYALKNAEIELKIKSPTLGTLFEKSIQEAATKVAARQAAAPLLASPSD